MLVIKITLQILALNGIFLKKKGREKMQDKYVYVGCHDLMYKMRYFFL